MNELRQTLRPEYFDAIYTADPDPWKFAASPYERAKYTLTLNAMPRSRYRSALNSMTSGRPRLSQTACSLEFRPPLVRPIRRGTGPFLRGLRRCGAPSDAWRRS